MKGKKLIVASLGILGIVYLMAMGLLIANGYFNRAPEVKDRAWFERRWNNEQ